MQICTKHWRRKPCIKTWNEITSEERTVYKSCFSGDTEVLTKEGWVRLDEYKAGEVAQYKLPASVKVYEGVEGYTVRCR